MLADSISFFNEACLPVIKIGDETIEVNVTSEDIISKEHTPLYRKEARDSLSKEKNFKLFNNAIKKGQSLYDFTSLDLTDEKGLDNLYKIQDTCCPYSV